MSLKQQVRDWLLKKVFRDPGRPKAKRAPAAGSNLFAWSVLVLDATTLRIVQSCFQGYELTAENVARIDGAADDKRIPTALHAIYFLAPVSYQGYFKELELLSMSPTSNMCSSLF